ncbi:MAG: alpha/beta hydrolase [Saprospiraceae bacterium]|nr:alpha/beta hydrolase [Saprospiraceae bacterium]
MKNILLKLISIYLNTINRLSNSIGGRHAFFIFCYPFKAKITKRQQAFLDTAHQFKLPLDNFEIQCYRWGNGPKNILFVHGWQSNTYRWKKYIDSLPKDQFTIYSFDAPGHGNSGSRIGNVPLFEKAIQKIMDHIGKAESIISHSIGSFSSLYYIHQHPQLQPKKLVTLATPDSIDDFLEYYFHTLKLSHTTIKNFKTYFEKYTQKDSSFFRLENLVQSNRSSGLIIHDEEDKAVTVEYSKKLHSLWPYSKLVITNGLGHKLKNENIVQMVNRFVSAPTPIN